MLAILRDWAQIDDPTNKIAEYFVSHETQLNEFCQLVYETLVTLQRVCPFRKQKEKGTRTICEIGRRMLELEAPATGYAKGYPILMELCFVILRVISRTLAFDLNVIWLEIEEWHRPGVRQMY